MYLYSVIRQRLQRFYGVLWKRKSGFAIQWTRGKQDIPHEKHSLWFPKPIRWIVVGLPVVFFGMLFYQNILFPFPDDQDTLPPIEMSVTEATPPVPRLVNKSASTKKPTATQSTAPDVVKQAANSVSGTRVALAPKKPKITTPSLPKHPRLSQLTYPVLAPIRRQQGWEYDRVLEDWRYHRGVEFGPVSGSVVSAALEGKVIRVDAHEIELEHGDGVISKYLNVEGSRVHLGEWVSTGGILAKAEAGKSVCFTLEQRGLPLDPLRYLRPDRAVQVQAISKTER